MAYQNEPWRLSLRLSFGARTQYEAVKACRGILYERKLTRGLWTQNCAHQERNLELWEVFRYLGTHGTAGLETSDRRKTVAW